MFAKLAPASSDPSVYVFRFVKRQNVHGERFAVTRKDIVVADDWSINAFELVLAGLFELAVQLSELDSVPIDIL